MLLAMALGFAGDSAAIASLSERISLEVCFWGIKPVWCTPALRLWGKGDVFGRLAQKTLQLGAPTAKLQKFKQSTNLAIDKCTPHIALS